jgi:hypothetical protein
MKEAEKSSAKGKARGMKEEKKGSEERKEKISNINLSLGEMWKERGRA